MDSDKTCPADVNPAGGQRRRTAPSSVGNDICLLCAEKSFQLERKAGMKGGREGRGSSPEREERGARLPLCTHTDTYHVTAEGKIQSPLPPNLSAPFYPSPEDKQEFGCYLPRPKKGSRKISLVSRTLSVGQNMLHDSFGPSPVMESVTQVCVS